MYNPFPLLTQKMLTDKIEAGKRYFVRQTYRRGLTPRLVAAFLLRGYEADEREHAEKHLASLSKDPYAFLYDASDPHHLQKLSTASKQPFGYKIFYAGKKGVDWKPPPDYQHKIKKFLRERHPEWKTSTGGGKIEIGLHEDFGQLFLTFNFESQTDKVPFEEIEK